MSRLRTEHVGRISLWPQFDPGNGVTWVEKVKERHEFTTAIQTSIQARGRFLATKWAQKAQI